MEKVGPWCGQPSDRGRLKNRTEFRSSSTLKWCSSLHIISSVRRSAPLRARSTNRLNPENRRVIRNVPVPRQWNGTVVRNMEIYGQVLRNTADRQTESINCTLIDRTTTALEALQTFRPTDAAGLSLLMRTDLVKNSRLQTWQVFVWNDKFMICVQLNHSSVIWDTFGKF